MKHINTLILLVDLSLTMFVMVFFEPSISEPLPLFAFFAGVFVASYAVTQILFAKISPALVRRLYGLSIAFSALYLLVVSTLNTLDYLDLAAALVFVGLVHILSRRHSKS
jgi:hypothetical protein